MGSISLFGHFDYGLQMKDMLQSHFNELLLGALTLILVAASIWILAKEGWQAADGFKWASGLCGTVLGALLALLMKRNPDQPKGPNA